MTTPTENDTAARPAATGQGSPRRSAAERRADLSTRVHSLGRYGFARASEEPYRRRPADGFWLVVGIVVMVLCAFHHDHPTKFEDDVFVALNGLPNSFKGFFETVFQLGSLWGVGLVIVAGLLARRWRLARDLALAGVLAWLIGRIVAELVGGESVSDAVDVIVRAGSSPSYPLVRLAVITAIVGAASPYLSRPTRWLGIVVVVVVMPAAMYLGLASVMDVFGGVALGVTMASAVHLLFGSPGGRPTTQQVALTLASLGVDAENLRLAPVQNLGRTLMLGDAPDGPLDVTVLGADERDAGFINKAWRFLVYRDSGPTLFRSRLQEVEHEAYLILRAQLELVQVPVLVEVGQAGPDAAVLVTRGFGGTALADLPPESVDDALLSLVWDTVGKLQDAGIAHGALDANHIRLLDDGSILLTDLRTASTAAPPGRLGADVATLLFVTSQIVGNDRAIDAAIASLGSKQMAAVVPYVQPPVLPSEVRKGNKGLKKSLEALRNELAQKTNVEVPQLEQLRRVSGRQAMMFAAAAFGIWFLIGMIGDPADLIDTLKDANWAWVLLGMGFWFVAEFGYALSMLGAIPPDEDVPFGPLTLLQIASTFLNLITSGMVAQFVMNTRFLQKRGVEVPTAVSTSAIPPIVYTVVQILVVLLTAGAVKDQLALSDVGTGGTSGGGDVQVVLILIIAIVIGVGVVLLIPKFRNKVLPTVKTTLHNLWTVLTSPRKVAYIFGGSILTQLMYALILGACLEAYGAHLSLAELIFVNTFVSLFGGLIPVPGGIGVFEAGLTAGLTALGIDPTIATAAVLTDRMLTAYIPPVFGYFSINWMTKHDYL